MVVETTLEPVSLVQVEAVPERLHQRVVLIGAGGIGFYLSLCLSRAGIEHEVWDDDDFSGGLGHTRLPLVENTKTKKVAYLRGFTMATMGDDAPSIFVDKFTAEHVDAYPELTMKGVLIVDATDMALTRRKVLWSAAKEAGARLLRVSYDGADGGIVAVSEGLPFSNKRVAGGYANVPTLELSFIAGGIGCTAVKKALYSAKRLEFQINIGELMDPASAVMSKEIE